MPDHRVFALILAAGQGRRFGADKLLAELSGKPLLRHVLDWVKEARDRHQLAGGLAVIPAGNVAREKILMESGLEYSFNPGPELGVAESLRLGLATLTARHPDALAALILQGDQPRLRREVLEPLVAAWQSGGRPVVRPRYAVEPEIPGHPVLLDRSVWDRANELRGDAGFAPLFKAYPDLVTTVDVPGTNPDINTPADLAKLESSPR
jgi:CTP:molybdopterin cytidylyltransferase MocA